MADTYHPFDWAQLVVANSGAYPLPHVGVVGPPVFPSVTLDNGVALTKGLVPNMAGRYFAESAFVPMTRGIVQTIEHEPPGAETWPDDIKPQFRVPYHTLAHAVEGTLEAAGTSAAEFIYQPFVPPPVVQPIWIPPPPRTERRREKVVIRATIDAALPTPEVEISGNVRVGCEMRAGLPIALVAIAAYVLPRRTRSDEDDEMLLIASAMLLLDLEDDESG